MILSPPCYGRVSSWWRSFQPYPDSSTPGRSAGSLERGQFAAFVGMSSFPRTRGKSPSAVHVGSLTSKGTTASWVDDHDSVVSSWESACIKNASVLKILRVYGRVNCLNDN